MTVPRAVPEVTNEDRLRFWRKVRRASGCWEWTGAPGKNGQYGAFRIKGWPYRINRVAWTLGRGPIPRGLHVLHHCDNTRCVRPDHLFLGTHVDNMHDCTAKGRRPTGEMNGMAVLTEAMVRHIRSSPKSARALGDELGINFETVYKVRQGKSWRWLI